jgi:hypothetical protein
VVFGPGRSEGPDAGRVDSRVRQSERGRPETGVTRGEGRTDRPDKREEASRGRSESRPGREGRNGRGPPGAPAARSVVRLGVPTARGE